MGDFNNKDIEEAIGDYGDISVCVTGPTRGNRTLDIAASSFNSEIHNAVVMCPLTSEEGTASDHGVIVYTAFLKHRHSFDWVRYSQRKITPAGWIEFDKCMRETDWNAILPSDAGRRVAYFHANSTAIRDRCFPMAHFKVCSTDDPWIDEAVRKKIQQRKDCFRNAG